MASGCDHNYETPKLLQKSPKTRQSASPPQVNRNTKPSSSKKEQNEQEDGYEPVGKAPLTMETWIAEKNNEFNAILVSDADTRNIDRKVEDKDNIKHFPQIEVDDSVSKCIDSDDIPLIHLQRNLSNNSIKSDSNDKISTKNDKEAKKMKMEEDKRL